MSEEEKLLEFMKRQIIIENEIVDFAEQRPDGHTQSPSEGSFEGHIVGL